MAINSLGEAGGRGKFEFSGMMAGCGDGLEFRVLWGWFRVLWVLWFAINQRVCLYCF